MEELEVVKKYLEYGVSPDTIADVVEIDSKRESLTSIEQHKILGVSLSPRKKWTYQSPEGKMPVQNPEWKAMAMSSFDFKDNPFQRIQEEMDQLQGHYSKMEFVTRRDSKVLGDCRPRNICKELKKLKQ